MAPQNPMLGALNQSKMSGLLGNLGQIKQMMNTLRAAQNPQAMIQQMAGNNPQLSQAMKLIQDSGGDGKAAFYKLAGDMGVDPEQIISALK